VISGFKKMLGAPVQVDAIGNILSSTGAILIPIPIDVNVNDGLYEKSENMEVKQIGGSMTPIGIATEDTIIRTELIKEYTPSKVFVNAKLEWNKINEVLKKLNP
jgi:hypothetical protein